MMLHIIHLNSYHPAAVLVQEFKKQLLPFGSMARDKLVLLWTKPCWFDLKFVPYFHCNDPILDVGSN